MEQPQDDLRPPSLARLIGEARTAFEAPRLLARGPALRRAPRGRSEPVLVLPGLGAGDASTWPLRRFLAGIGHRPHGWHLGVNTGNVEDLLPRVQARAEAIRDRAGRPVHLVGWSLGGVLARELARDTPALAAQVISFGTPVVGGPKYTRAAARYAADEVDRVAAIMADRRIVPITVPVTSIYSRNDGIVDWRACIDDDTPGARNIEVRSTHLGMGIDPDVWQILAETLTHVTVDR